MTLTMNEKTKQILSYSEAGFILTPLRGKIPLEKNWTKTLYEFDPDPAKFPENFGVVLQDDDLVVDIDPRNFPQGDQPHKRLIADLGITLKDSGALIVKTGSGGLHIYYKKPAEIKTKYKIEKYPGIEFRTKGHQMVGAGSLHPDTKKPYEIIHGALDKITQAPETLIALLRTEKKEAAVKKDASPTDSPYDVERFIKYCTEAEPALEGDSGDRTTYKVACQGRNLGLSQVLTFELMARHYNPRCLPPWDEDALLRKVENAYAYAKGGAGEARAETDFEASNELVHQLAWDRTKNNQLLKTLRNAVNFFMTPTNPLFGTVAFDEFLGQVMIVKPLPWSKEKHIARNTMWSDSDTVQCRYYLGAICKFDAPVKLIDEAVLTVGRMNKFHPVREYLIDLKWDGVKRLDTWLSDYCSVRDSAYARTIGRKTLLQAVARVFQPGCKADHVLILEGPQGIGKSTIVNILGGIYYAALTIDPHARDTVDAMRGRWIIELEEMEVTRRADAQALKAFITRQTDRVRLAYGRHSIDYPRQCIFIGTINPDATSEYFTDATGNRRFWPVVIGYVKMLELQAIRDQLFAEATQRHMEGESLHIEDRAVLGEALKEQEKRQSTDPWEEQIQNYLLESELANNHGFTTSAEIWEYALRGSRSQFSKHQANRIANVLRRLGWTYNAYVHPTTKEKLKAFRNFNLKPKSGYGDGELLT